jgi:hypothetical protein
MRNAMQCAVFVYNCIYKCSDNAPMQQKHRIDDWKEKKAQ